MFPLKSIWTPKVPRKVCFFSWLAVRGVIKTDDNLWKRKVIFIQLALLMQEGGKRGR